MIISDLLQNIVNLAFLILVALVSLLIRQIYTHLSTDKQAKVQQVASMVVPAVEQQCLDLAGPQKKAQAVNLVSNFLTNDLKIKNVSPQLISIAIEAAVRDMNQALVALPKPKAPTPLPTSTISDLTR
jgi:LL-H family phage holin